MSISTDTAFVHKAWHDNSPAIGHVSFPMAADPTGTLTRLFGTHIEKEGISLRGTFIIDPEGILRFIYVTDLEVGRNVDEVLRVLGALQTGGLTPCNWKPGDSTLKV